MRIIWSSSGYQINSTTATAATAAVTNFKPKQTAAYRLGQNLIIAALHGLFAGARLFFVNLLIFSFFH